MTCLPCVKEILNNGAKLSNEQLAMAAEEIPKLVERGRLTIPDAEKFLEKAIEIDTWYCDHVREALMEHFENVKSPWEARL